jgi:topoisomerase-4 subunit B
MACLIGQHKPSKVDLRHYLRFKIEGNSTPFRSSGSLWLPATTKRAVQLSLSKDHESMDLLDMMLAKKRSPDRKKWLESKGDLIE